MNKTKSIIVASLMASIGWFTTACNSDEMRRNPGRIYAPDMTYSRAYEAYTESPNFTDSQASRLAVTGTIAVGHDLPDHLIEGDTNSYKSLTTSYRFNEAEIKEGERLYMIYCGICHGGNHDGNGPLYASGKFSAMPANLKDPKYMAMNVGTMYAAIKFGKNLMGSYASQLNPKQRWQVIAHIKKMQSENGGAAFTLGKSSDSTQMVTVNTIDSTATTKK